jgi:hypothetical protein
MLAFSDDFSEDAVGSVAAGWDVVSGTWWVCQAGPLAHGYAKTTADTSESLSNTASLSNFTVDALINDPNVTRGGAGIIGRVQNPDQFYQLELRSQVNGSAAYWYVEKANRGTWTILAGGPLQAPDANPNYRLHLVFAGNRITASIAFDGGSSYRALGTVTDSSFPSGRVGIRLGYEATARFKDITVTIAPGALSSESAVSSTTFVDSIGLNAHFEAPNYSNYPLVNSLIGKLGVRHYRVSAAQILVYGGSYLGELTSLWKSYGTSYDVLTNLRTSAADVVKAVKALPAGSVDSVEGPNEVDDPTGGTGSTYDPNFPSDVPAYMRLLYAAIKSNPATSQVSVIGPSFANSWAYAAIGNIAASVDAGNMHDYFGGFNPGTLGWGGITSFAPGLRYGAIDWNIASSARATGSKPIVATETGYSTAPIHGGVPLAVQSKYVPRLYFEHYRHHVPRTFMYQLIDWNTWNYDGTLGIVSSSYVASPAFNALAGMITLLRDGGLKSAPVNYSWILTGQTTNVDHVLLHKADGTLIVPLWIEVPSFGPNVNGGLGAELSVPAQTVSIILARSSATGVVWTCNPANGMWSSRPITATNGSLTLRVNDSVSIVEIAPS